MRKHLYGLAAILVMLVGTKASAQQAPQFTQYMFNSMFLNPAYAGIEGAANFSLIHRSQWLGYTGSFDEGGAPTTQVFSFNTPLLKINSGIGLHVINDNIAAQNNISAALSYSYHIKVGEGKLGLGVRGGIYSRSLDFGKFRAVDVSDPVIQQGTEQQMKPDLGAGAWYRSRQFYVGASVNHIMQSEFDFGLNAANAQQIQNTLVNNLIVTGGYNFDLSPTVRLTPSAILKMDDYDEYSYEGTVLATFNDKYWGGLGYRDRESVSALIGANLLSNNALRVGYAFDYVAFNDEVLSNTSHEILLQYTLPVSSNTNKPIVRTPRFRH